MTDNEAKELLTAVFAWTVENYPDADNRAAVEERLRPVREKAYNGCDTGGELLLLGAFFLLTAARMANPSLVDEWLQEQKGRLP